MLSDADLPEGAVVIGSSVHHSNQVVCPHCASEQGEFWKLDRRSNAWTEAECSACGKHYAFCFSRFLTCVSDRNTGFVKGPRIHREPPP